MRGDRGVKSCGKWLIDRGLAPPTPSRRPIAPLLPPLYSWLRPLRQTTLGVLSRTIKQGLPAAPTPLVVDKHQSLSGRRPVVSWSREYSCSRAHNVRIASDRRRVRGGRGAEEVLHQFLDIKHPQQGQPSSGAAPGTSAASGCCHALKVIVAMTTHHGIYYLLLFLFYPLYLPLNNLPYQELQANIFKRECEG